MRSIFAWFYGQVSDLTDANEALRSARNSLHRTEDQRRRADFVAQRARWSRETNHFSEGMARALSAPRITERTRP